MIFLSVSTQEIQQETDIPDNDLLRALLPLYWGKPSQRVLVKEPDCKQIKKEDIFTVNDEFSSKKYKVKMKLGEEGLTLAQLCFLQLYSVFPQYRKLISVQQQTGFCDQATSCPKAFLLLLPVFSCGSSQSSLSAPPSSW